VAKSYNKMHRIPPFENICGGMGLCLELFSELTRPMPQKDNQSSKITFLPTAWILTFSVGTQFWVVTSFLKTLNMQNN
jgi:hypothetical protein